MNNHFLFMYGFWLIELLAAAGVVFWVVRFCRANADGPIARLMHHRDRIWFALLLLFVPAIVSHFLFLHFFWRPGAHGPNILAPIVSMIINALYGAAYGMAGCWFACPARREERFSYGTALTVTVVLIILISGLSTLIRPFRNMPAANLPIMLAAAVILAFLISRAFVGKRPEPPQAGVANTTPNETEYNPAPAFLWLLVGLAPIPILLALVSSRAPRPAWGVSLFFLCVVCNLLGGLGCLRGIKNMAVRIILGLFLGAIFFVLSCVVAIFQACSGHVGM